MRFKKLFVVIGVAIIASVVACGLLLISSAAPYSSPEKSLTAFVDAGIYRPTSLPWRSQPAGRYIRTSLAASERKKYREVRNTYQEAYDLAEPQWEQYTRQGAGCGREGASESRRRD